MRTWTIRLLGGLGCLILSAGGIYGVSTGRGKWTAPCFVFISGVMLLSAWRNRSRRSVFRFWWPLACAILVATSAVDTLTGYSLPLEIAVWPCMAMAVAALVEIHRAGWQIRRLK